MHRGDAARGTNGTSLKRKVRSLKRYLKDRVLKEIKLCIADTCIVLVEWLAKFYTEARWQRFFSNDPLENFFMIQSGVQICC